MIQNNPDNISPEDLERARRFANESSEQAVVERIRQMCRMVYAKFVDEIKINNQLDACDCLIKQFNNNVRIFEEQLAQEQDPYKKSYLKEYCIEGNKAQLTMQENRKKALSQAIASFQKSKTASDPFDYWVEFEALMTSLFGNDDDARNTFFQQWKKFIIPIRRFLGMI